MPVYAPSTVLAWNIAAIEAKSGHAVEIAPAHLLLGICKLCDLDIDRFCPKPIRENPAQRQEFQKDIQILRQWFDNWGLDPTVFRRRLRTRTLRADRVIAHQGIMHRDHAARQVFNRAEEICHSQALREPTVRPCHLLQALFELPDAPWEGLLNEMGIYQLDQPPQPDNLDWESLELIPDESGTPIVLDEEVLYFDPERCATPLLDTFGKDLTHLARQGLLDPTIGREREIQSLASILMQRRKRNAILVGEAGVGKTCIVEGLTQWLMTEAAPIALRNKRVVEVSMAALLAGSKYRGEFEERIQGIVAEATRDRNTILFIDEIHTVLGAGGAGASDAANILKPALARGDLHCIGATTVREYRQTIEKDGALERRFQVVWVTAPSPDETRRILKGLRPQFEQHHNLRITDEAIEAAVSLTGRYITDASFPDKAIDVIDRACANARLLQSNLEQQPTSAYPRATGTAAGATTSESTLPPLVRQDIIHAIAERCRLPIERLTEDERTRLLRMESFLRRQVMGQDRAIEVVSDAIRTARSGLKVPHRPVGVFLFVGKTGTGKTRLAQALAEFLFDDPRRLIRIDMSEYMEQNSVSRLIGAPPGYIGHETEGQLSGAVRSNPYSVVLFDEIEKAHPQVLDLLLQVLDEGRLTDSQGNEVCFSETTIILTSNIGTTLSNRGLGFDFDLNDQERLDLYEAEIHKALEQRLRPELLNRIGEVVCFHPLSPAIIRQIVDKLLGSIRDRLSERQITINIADEAYELLVDRGYNPDLGAREMERTIERLLVRPIGHGLLSNRFVKNSTISISVSDGELTFDAPAISRPPRFQPHESFS